MKTLEHDHAIAMPVLAPSVAQASSGKRIAVWSGLVGFSAAVWTVVLLGGASLLG